MIAPRFVSVALQFTCLALVTGTVSAADRVWLQPPNRTSSQSEWFPRAVQTLRGTIVTLDANQLRLRPEDATAEGESLIASHRVIWAQPDQLSQLESEAIELFVDRKYAESLSRLPDILKQRPPVWWQQWMTMMAAVAAWKSGRSSISIELVGQLDSRSLPPIAIAWLPVAWENGVQPADAMAAAKERISDPSPAVQLVAASWLLSSPERSRAIKTLTSLQSGSRVEIARLAEVLLWRTATPPQVIRSASAWQARLEALPMVLQTGPTKTLIEKLRSAGKTEAADRLKWSIELTPIHPGFP